MGECPGCGFAIPFLVCPHCPPTPFTCPRCGEVSVVERMSVDEFNEIVGAREEEAREPVVVDLGDFKFKKVENGGGVRSVGQGRIGRTFLDESA